MARASLAAALCGLWGCSGGAPDPSDGDTAEGLRCTEEDITLEIGAGAEGYHPLAGGDVVSIVHGPQGGWHLETAGLVTHSTSEIAILPRLYSEELDLEITGAQQPDYKALVGYDDATCQGTYYATRAFLDTVRETGPQGLDFVCALSGATVTLSAVITDLASPRQASDQVEIVLELDPDDVEPCGRGRRARGRRGR